MKIAFLFLPPILLIAGCSLLFNRKEELPKESTQKKPEDSYPRYNYAPQVKRLK